MRKNCDNCKYDAWDYVGAKPCSNCVSKGEGTPSFWEASENYSPMTNADRIRAMTDEELASYMAETVLQQCPCPTKNCEPVCNDCILNWMKRPAEE